MHSSLRLCWRNTHDFGVGKHTPGLGQPRTLQKPDELLGTFRVISRLLQVHHRFTLPVGGSLCGVPVFPGLSRVFPARAVACPSFSSSFAYRPLLLDLACPVASWSRVLCAVFWWGFGVPSLEFPRVPLLPFRVGCALKIQGEQGHLTASTATTAASILIVWRPLSA